MDIKLSQRVQRIKPSPTLAVTARASELRATGQDVIDLAAGQPDFDTPDTIKQAGIQAIEAGFTKYPPVPGMPGLRQAIADKLRRENDLDYRNEQILVSAGAKHSLFNLTQALLDEGDEVVIAAPYWVSYPDMVLLAGAQPVVVATGYEDNFKITPQQLEEAITPRTRLFIINSPSNPTGKGYSRSELAALGEVLSAHPDVVVASDDIYEYISWADEPFTNIVNACPDLRQRTVVVNGVSKGFAMTGWRIGYVAGPPALVKAMSKIQGQSTSGATSISQKAAEEALSGGRGRVREMVSAFQSRHDFVYQALNELPNVRCLRSDGTFYAFPDFNAVIAGRDDIDDDAGLARMLIEDAGVALVPGSAFGASGFLRASFANSMENLERAMQRLQKALS